jgi:beta-glucosidase
MAPNKMIGYFNEGQFTEDLVDDAVLRILRQKLKFAHKGDPKIYSMEKIACKEHTELALKAARKSIVLLKNKNSILPFKRNGIKQIAIFGSLANIPNIGDHGSSRVYPPYVITPLEGIRKVAGNTINITYSEGNDLEAAKELAKNSEVSIIIAGYTHIDEGEGSGTKERTGDRKSLRLYEKDEVLISAIASVNEKCIVALEGGGPIIVEPWKNKVAAILMLWYPGMEGGTALGEILFGDVNPSAKLPAVFPKSEDQLPFFDANATQIEYGYYHGYKLMDKEGYEPTFPFGFGLSYTTFAYDNFRLDNKLIKSDGEIQISIDVSNTGNMTGEEIIQMYVGYENSSVDRPVKDLKGFTKAILNPGEIKTINLNLKAKDLAYYNVDGKEWVVEKIDYIIYVGSSSRKEDLLTVSFKIS